MNMYTPSLCVADGDHTTRAEYNEMYHKIV